MKTKTISEDMIDTINNIIRSSVSSEVDSAAIKKDLTKVRRELGNDYADELIASLGLAVTAQIFPSYLDFEVL